MAQKTASVTLGTTELDHLQEAVAAKQEHETRTLGRKNSTLTKVQVKLAKARTSLDVDEPEPEAEAVEKNDESAG